VPVTGQRALVDWLLSGPAAGPAFYDAAPCASSVIDLRTHALDHWTTNLNHSKSHFCCRYCEVLNPDELQIPLKHTLVLDSDDDED
jgi:hypothetical protein